MSNKSDFALNKPTTLFSFLQIINKNTVKDNKWSKNFDERLHCREGIFIGKI